MEAIVAEIKADAKILDTSLTTTDPLVDMIVREAIDRALSYTNRTQLIYQYEDTVRIYGFSPDLTKNKVWNAETYDPDGGFFHGKIACPIPVQLRKALARATVSLYKTIINNITTPKMAVSSVTDNGQSVSYKNETQSFMATINDTAFFSGITELLDKFVIFSV